MNIIATVLLFEICYFVNFRMDEFGAHIEGMPSPIRLLHKFEFYVSNHAKFAHGDQLSVLAGIRDESWILLPVYYDMKRLPEESVRKNPGENQVKLLECCYDTQAQASETVKIGESSVDAAQRCALEEFGIAASVESFKCVGKHGSVVYYTLDMDCAVTETSSPLLYNNIVEECGKRELLLDDRSRKIGLYITVNMTSLDQRRLLSMRKRIRRADADENIHDAGHVIFIVKKSKLVRIVRKLREKYDEIVTDYKLRMKDHPYESTRIPYGLSRFMIPLEY
jgi:hypothetical protein